MCEFLFDSNGNVSPICENFPSQLNSNLFFLKRGRGHDQQTNKQIFLRTRILLLIYSYSVNIFCCRSQQHQITVSIKTETIFILLINSKILNFNKTRQYFTSCQPLDVVFSFFLGNYKSSLSRFSIVLSFSAGPHFKSDVISL